MDNGKMLICRQCKERFTMTVDELELYEKMGFENKPERCRKCTGAQAALNSAVKPKKELHKAVCVRCEKECELPFAPRGDKPVLCQACFLEEKKNKHRQKLPTE